MFSVLTASRSLVLLLGAVLLDVALLAADEAHAVGWVATTAAAAAGRTAARGGGALIALGALGAEVALHVADGARALLHGLGAAAGGVAILTAERAVSRVGAVLADMALLTAVVAGLDLLAGRGIRAVAGTVAGLAAVEAGGVRLVNVAGAVTGEVTLLAAAEARGVVGRAGAVAALVINSATAVADHV